MSLWDARELERSESVGGTHGSKAPVDLVHALDGTKHAVEQRRREVGARPCACDFLWAERTRKEAMSAHETGGPGPRSAKHDILVARARRRSTRKSRWEPDAR